MQRHVTLHAQRFLHAYHMHLGSSAVKIDFFQPMFGTAVADGPNLVQVLANLCLKERYCFSEPCTFYS